MTTEDQLQSSNIQESNGPENDDTTCDYDNELPVTTSTSTTSGRPVRRSRFFRSKRKQRIVDEKPNPAEDSGNASETVVDPPESEGKIS